MDETWTGDARIIRESPSGKAWLIDIEGETMWIPKSGVHDDSEVWKDEPGYNEGTLILEGWIARKKGLI